MNRGRHGDLPLRNIRHRTLSVSCQIIRFSQETLDGFKQCCRILGETAPNQDRRAVRLRNPAHILYHEQFVARFLVSSGHVYVLAEPALERSQLQLQSARQDEHQVNVRMTTVEVNGIARSEIRELPRAPVFPFFPRDLEMQKLDRPPGICAQDRAVRREIARESRLNRSEEAFSYLIWLNIFHDLMGCAILGRGFSMEACEGK